MKFLVDENLAVALANGLHGFGEDVQHLTEIFEPGTPDTVWLGYAGRHGYAVLTRDNAIRRRPAERAAVKNHNLRAFFLVGDYTTCQLIQQVVRNWPEIKRLARKTRPPCAFVVKMRGEIEEVPLQ